MRASQGWEPHRGRRATVGESRTRADTKADVAAGRRSRSEEGSAVKSGPAPVGALLRHSWHRTTGRDRDKRGVRAAYDPRSVRATDAIASGPTRQHPPTSRAPASRQPVTRDAENVASPVQARARASHRSPLFG